MADLISWLEQISQIIEDDAALLPVVPDRRFSFDVLLAATTVDQLLQALELREVRPSVRAVYTRAGQGLRAVAPWWTSPARLQR